MPQSISTEPITAGRLAPAVVGWRRRATLAAATATLALTLSGTATASALPTGVSATPFTHGRAAGLAIDVQSAPSAACRGKVVARGEELKLPELATTDAGKAGWSFLVNPKAPSGHWRLRIRCQNDADSGFGSASRMVRTKNGGPRGGSPAQHSTLRTTAGTRTDRIGFGSGGNSYPYAQCTWWAKQRSGWAGNYWGNAEHWDEAARAAGFPVHRDPWVGSIAVWQPYQCTGDHHGCAGGYGHVAYVEGINSNGTIHISEYNWPTGAGLRYADINPAGLTFIGGQTPDRPPPNWPLTNGEWYLRNSLSAGPGDYFFKFASPRDLPVAGDWNGDGIDSPGVFRRSEARWYIRNDFSTGGDQGNFLFATANDQPVAGDWTGDGTDSAGVFRPQTGSWHLRNSLTSGGGDLSFQFASPGDMPVVGDWNGDGTDTPGVFRPSNATWYLRNDFDSGGAQISFQFASAGDYPLAGDWNGDGTDEVGVFRSSNVGWYVRDSLTSGPATASFQYGLSTDYPVVGDWNNDAIDSPGVGR